MYPLGLSSHLLRLLFYYLQWFLWHKIDTEKGRSLIWLFEQKNLRTGGGLLITLFTHINNLLLLMLDFLHGFRVQRQLACINLLIFWRVSFSWVSLLISILWLELFFWFMLVAVPLWPNRFIIDDLNLDFPLDLWWLLWSNWALHLLSFILYYRADLL